MSWKRLDVEFTLKSPLHIGYLPFKGSVISLTRYYVPGKNFWGAITKRLTEHLYENPRGNNYQNIGDQIKDNFRFTYFYVHDGKITYLPDFKDDDGLKYGDKSGKIPKNEFENKFIGSRVMTAVDSGGSGTAEDGSLHETEFISNNHKNKKGNIKNTKIVGCIFIKNGGKIKTADGKEYDINTGDGGLSVDDFNVIQELTLGGEQKYGFGIVEFTGINNIEYPLSPNLEKDEITVSLNENPQLLSHLEYSTNLPFIGDIELVSGREYKDSRKNKEEDDKRYIGPGKNVTRTRRYFAPGTSILKVSEATMDATMDYSGMLKLKSIESGDNGVDQ